MGVLDFAGGTVVHMSAGWAALAGAMFLGKRKLKKSNPARITYVLLELDYYGLVGLASMLVCTCGKWFGSTALGTTTVAAAAAEWLDIL
jgi:Amt family ammonium transporter